MFKTKYVRGRMSRNVRNSFFDDYRIRATLWGINLKPGDVFNSFDGLNHVVETTEIVWHRPNKMPLSEKTLKKRGINPSTLPTQSMKDYGRGVRGEYVSDVEIHSVDGMMHFLSETGCIVPAFTREQMRRYIIIQKFLTGKNFVESLTRMGFFYVDLPKKNKKCLKKLFFLRSKQNMEWMILVIYSTEKTN